MYKKWAFEMLSVDRSDAGGYKVDSLFHQLHDLRWNFK